MSTLGGFLGRQSQRVVRLAASAAERMRAIPGLALVEQLLRAYSEDRCSIPAAALSYYTLLSLFPLMLFILAVISPLTTSNQATREVIRFVGEYLPAGTDLLRSSLEEVIKLRGPISIVAALGFLWSASGVFSLIQLGLNNAFRVRNPRPIWRERVVSLAMVIGVSALFSLSFLFTTGIRLAIHYRLVPRHDILVDTLPPVLATLLGLGTFGLLYRYIPYDPTIRWKDVALPALAAAALWEGAKLVFAWYISNLATLNLVYGSLGTIIALMLWGYISAVILLGGAELAAVMSGARSRAQLGGESRLTSPTPAASP